jgi:hypothetical protein
MNVNAAFVIVADGEFADELDGSQPSHVVNVELSPDSDGGAGAFDGHASVGWRNPAGMMAGIQGVVDFGKTVTEIGITQAWGYSSNVANVGPGDMATEGLFCGSWKHNQFMGPAEGAPANQVHDSLIGLPKNLADHTPYHVRFQYNGATQAQCVTARGNTTINKGNLSCYGTRLDVGPEPEDYVQSTDFPFGSWGCARSHTVGYGNAPDDDGGFSFKLWHDGELIVDFTGFDGRLLREGLYNMKWNNFANGNQGPPESDCGVDIESTEAAYRYEDNIHIREGEPVSCYQIGFDFGPTPTPTVSPTTSPSPTVSPTSPPASPTASPTVSPTPDPSGPTGMLP